MNIDFDNLTPEMIAFLDEELRHAREERERNIISVGWENGK